ncbi:clumping factor B-like [Littorina saxatilis]|uniref:clumping factor B-like n=1 Tax=Littorina saxatilis TaxID=31220 RepID=UPI0038B59D50
MGDKKEEKEEGGEEGDESGEEEPPTKCSRFLKCIFCGGAGMCLLSFLFCISCGKVMSKKFIWRKDKDIQDAESNRKQPSPPPEETQPSPPPEETQPSPPPEETQPSPPPEETSQDSLDSAPVYLQDVFVEGDPNSSGSAETKPDNPEEQQAAVIKQPKTATFTEQYFATASWLENPHQDISQDKSKSYSAFSSTKLHGYCSSDSKVHIKQSDNKQDDDTNKSDQKVNDDGKGAAENVVSETGEAITEEMMLGQT